MALVVLLKGVNVGGHRTFRPAALAGQLRHLNAVNIGTAGTFVIREPVTRARLRAEFSRRLPFEAQIMICAGEEITGLVAQDWFTRLPVRQSIVRFASLLAGKPRRAPATPLYVPARRGWMLHILTREGRFVIGRYRRRMQSIRYLGMLDQMFGVPATTRSWSTICTIAGVLTRGDIPDSA